VELSLELRGIGAPTRNHEAFVGLYFLEGVYKQLRALFGHKPAQEEHK